MRMTENYNREGLRALDCGKLESFGMAFLGKSVRVGMNRVALGGVALVLSLGLAGCAGFFSCEGKTSCPATGTGTGTGSTTVDYAYVANSAAGSTYINGYAVSAGALTATTSSPYQLSYVPQAMVVSTNNSFLYVASSSSTTTGSIYGYSIGSGGTLSVLSSGSPLQTESAVSLAVSPDGKWLFALNTDGLSLEQYSLNSSTGAVTFAANYSYSGATTGVITPLSVKVAPSGNFVAIALGTAGVVTFPFTTSTGFVGQNYQIISPANASSGLYAMAIDGSGYLYTAGTAGLQVFSTNSSGVPTQVGSTAYTTGNGPRAMVINPAYTYVYTANQTDGSITADALNSGGTLTGVTGSAFSGPSTVTALGVDSTGAYLVAAGYSGSSGIQIFSIGSSGALTLNGSSASGTSTAIPVAIAMTH
jgi:6-phosphogluconolactonase (cycloisomerase 2 family)